MGEFPYPTPHPPLSHRNPQQMPPHIPYIQAPPMISCPLTDDFRGCYNMQASHGFPIQHNTQVRVSSYI